MKVFRIFYIFMSYVAICAAFCHPEASNVEVKLKNDILCQYKKDVRPHQLDLQVELNYGVRSFSFNDRSSRLTIEARILHRWDDLRLRWNENDYAGIQMITVNSDSLWIPRLFLNNSRHHYGLGTCHPTQCLIKSSGQIGCWIPCNQELDCNADYSDWPYDSHTCQVMFNTFYINENVVFNSDLVSGQVVINANNEWKLSSMKGLIDTKNNNAVRFIIHITRYSGTIYKHVIVPLYCLIAFSLVIFWIKPENFWRLIFCGLNIYFHFGLMDRVWWQFPTNGASKNTPKILKTMIFMLILSTIILIESISLKIMSIRYSMPPLWIEKIVNISDNNSIIKYAMMSPMESKSEGDETSADKSKKNAMKAFNAIIDRTLFFIFSIFYLFFIFI